MTEIPTTDADEGLAEIIEVLTELMRTATRPEVLEAQRILLQRLALQGDVFPSRVPPPRNITEVGGYLNLLSEMSLHDTRANAVASALGIAGPTPGVGFAVAGHGFVEIANDRPAGPAQFSIPPMISVRADFVTALLSALAVLHTSGCALPLRPVAPGLPAVVPGPAPALDQSMVLAALGRVLEVFPGTVLIDPAVDALAVARPDQPAVEPLRLVARELDGGTLVPEASWVSLRADATSVAEDVPAPARYLDVAPVLEAQGWYHPEPLLPPTSLAARGTLVQLVNRTGLIAGETTLGAELATLYTSAQIGQSALAAHVHDVWDGQGFGATP
ncbi:hypothetical protein [uncultured Serinicoccus sp.]|uniref:hypothetical protein n=1 Tax=uncultured Serinicoccus sp. TaxID=735514 RepID=UPI00262607D8|nr:hypothetical protein [uncultured Serinicoccus sp.]